MDEGEEAEIDPFVSTWGMRSRFELRALYVRQNSFGVRMVADIALRKVDLALRMRETALFLKWRKLRRADSELDDLAKRK